MADIQDLERAREFQSELFAWTALHHFLSAGLLRELAAATVAVCAPGHTLEDIFEDHLTGPGVADTWSIVPKPVEPGVLRFLQHHVRVLVWANDADTYPHTIYGEEVGTWAEGLGRALRLGQLDFGVESWALDRFQSLDRSSAEHLLDALRVGRVGADGGQIVLQAIEVPLRRLQLPLQAVAFKHFGDLCADVDAWDEAAELYAAADAVCAAIKSPVWQEFAQNFADIIKQSRGLAAWIVRGPNVAASQLRPANEAKPSAARLLVLNGSHDALVATMDADHHGDWRDLRSSTLMPPLLLSSHGVTSAVRSWQTGEYDDAHRHFWSVLRRQVSLGSYSESGNTKALYGWTLLDEVSGVERGPARTETFQLGARLLVEAGRSKGVEALNFRPAVVEQYVSQELVKELAQIADRHAGAHHLRSLVLIELLAKWAEVSPRENRVLAGAILGELIARTKKFEATFHANKNVGGQGLTLLCRLATRRPDLRRSHGGGVAELIAQKLDANGWWTGTSGALELALAYADVLEPEPLRWVLAAALRALQRTTPEDGMWPIVRPALQLLASPGALEAAADDPIISPGYMSSLLRYGVAHRSAGVGLLFALSRFPGDVPLTTEDRAALEQVVDEVRAGAQERNSSSVTDFIRAVLAAAPHAGPYAVREAIDSLTEILLSGARERASIAFPYAYGPILDILEKPDAFTGVGISQEEFEERLVDIGDALLEAWTAIVQRPELLARFSIPPEHEPDSTVVHNWSVTTQKFIKRCGANERLSSLLNRAAAQPALAAGMQRAALSAAPPDQLKANELESLQEEGAETFYAAVGRRLRIAQVAPEPVRVALLQGLLRRCLMLGPRELDLAIFIAAAPVRHQLNLEIEGSDYLRQLAREWQLSMNIEPYLRPWLATS